MTPIARLTKRMAPNQAPILFAAWLSPCWTLTNTAITPMVAMMAEMTKANVDTVSMIPFSSLVTCVNAVLACEPLCAIENAGKATMAATTIRNLILVLIFI